VWSAVKRGQRSTDLRIAYRSQPACRLIASRLGPGSNQARDDNIREPCHDRGGADPLRGQLRRHRIEQRRILTATSANVEHFRHELEQRMHRRRFKADGAADQEGGDPGAPCT
jgi:hypothetical protein